MSRSTKEKDQIRAAERRGYGWIFRFDGTGIASFLTPEALKQMNESMPEQGKKYDFDFPMVGEFLGIPLRGPRP